MLSKEFAERVKAPVRTSREKQFASRTHARAMSAIGKLRPENLTARQAAFTYGYVRDAIETLEDRSGRTDSHYICEEGLAEEIFFLKELGAHRQYSTRIGQWAAKRTADFTSRLALDDEFHCLVNTWPNMPMEARGMFVINFIRLQLAHFSSLGVAFEAPPIYFSDLDKGINGIFCCKPVTSPISETYIEIDKTLMKRKKAYVPLGTAFHEGIHAMSWQLAAAAKAGTLRKGHPLLEDASNRMVTIELRGQFSTNIRTTGFDCPEETLAYFTQFGFERALHRQLCDRACQSGNKSPALNNAGP